MDHNTVLDCIKIGIVFYVDSYHHLKYATCIVGRLESRQFINHIYIIETAMALEY